MSVFPKRLWVKNTGDLKKTPKQHPENSPVWSVRKNGTNPPPTERISWATCLLAQVWSIGVPMPWSGWKEDLPWTRRHQRSFRRKAFDERWCFFFQMEVWFLRTSGDFWPFLAALLFRPSNGFVLDFFRLLLAANPRIVWGLCCLRDVFLWGFLWGWEGYFFTLNRCFLVVR